MYYTVTFVTCYIGTKYNVLLFCIYLLIKCIPIKSYLSILVISLLTITSYMFDTSKMFAHFYEKPQHNKTFYTGQRWTI